MAFVNVTAAMAAPLRGAKRWAYLARQEFIRVATTNDDGSLYLSTLWYVTRDQVIYLPVDAASRHGVNLLAGRPFTALVDSGHEYTTVAGVRIDGTVSKVTDAALIESLQQAVFDKYFYVDHPHAEAYFGFGKAAGRTYYALKPTRMIGWDSREVAPPQAVELNELPAHVTDRRV